MTPIEHAQKICQWFTKLALDKYMAGQEEHGGRLWRKPVWKLIRDEVIDMPIYFQVIEEQQIKIEMKLGEALVEFQRENYTAAQLKVQTAYNLITFGNEEGKEEEER